MLHTPLQSLLCWKLGLSHDYASSISPGGWGGENCILDSPFHRLLSPLRSQEPPGIRTGRVGGYPDRYFYFMRCHFCLDLSDPLILRGTLFPCDVKTPELEILFLVSFQKLKTLFRAEPDTHQAWCRRIIP